MKHVGTRVKITASVLLDCGREIEAGSVGTLVDVAYGAFGAAGYAVLLDGWEDSIWFDRDIVTEHAPTRLERHYNRLITVACGHQRRRDLTDSLCRQRRVIMAAF